MKLVAALIPVMLFATPTSAQQPWEGIWLESSNLCDDFYAKEKAIRLSRTEMEGADFSCRIVRTRKGARNSWTVSMRCWDGEAAKNATQTLVLMDAGYLVRRDESGEEEELARCDAVSEATKKSIMERRKFLGCEGSGCRLTAIEWRNLDTGIAWAVGRRSPDDAAITCRIERELERGSSAFRACLKEQTDAPAFKISANCEEGSTIVSGLPYRITDAAREGALRSSELSGYWDTSPPYSIPSRSSIIVMASWFRALCPTTSIEWNMKPQE